MRSRCRPPRAGSGSGATPACAPAATATLAADTVGYEWDEDLDNGARPPGLVRLSATTASGVEKLLDFGSTYGPGTATHRLTLYRDANGAGPDALVFGAGTVQWSWGLDGEHDRGGSTPSVPMQQATVNLFADMLVQPATLQAGLTPAGASTDTTPPSFGAQHADPNRHRGHPGDRQRHRRRQWRRASRRRRGLRGRRFDLAPRHGTGELELYVDADRRRPGHGP